MDTLSTTFFSTKLEEQERSPSILRAIVLARGIGIQTIRKGFAFANVDVQ